MKKLLLMTAACAALLTLDSCKSQKTLSEATTVADPTEDEVTEIAPIQYVKPEAPAKTSEPVVPAAQPTTPAVVQDRTERVTVVNSTESGMLKGFNVIVGSFGSKTNAENQKAKMVGRGYKAFLVQNNSGMYRVVAASFDTREAATAVRDRIRSPYSTAAGTCTEARLLIPQR